MSEQASGYEAAPSMAGMMIAGLVGGLAAFLALTLIATTRNGGVFEYALDDVYIHLTIAGEIARGGYGINPGEVASASSSPLYPFLLAPFVGTPLERWSPLIFNVVALVLTSVLFARAMAAAGMGRIGIILSALAPLALATYVTAFAGMENALHVAASLATVLGLWTFVQTGRVGLLLLAGIVLASALRLEGLALGLAVAGVAAFVGRTRVAVVLATLALAPVLAFAAYLIGLGLDPLPNSIAAKMQDTGAGGPIAKFGLNIRTYGGRYLLALAAFVLLVSLAEYRRDRRAGLFGLAVAGAGFAHLSFGSTGWLDRYETYANVSLVAALALLLSNTKPLVRQVTVSLALLGGLWTYAPYALSVYAWNPAAITAQHAQLARLAADHVNGPVAVNDIGYVAWQDPDYVLDLWGLASSEVLATRLSEPERGWAGPLVAERGIALVMVYDEWLGEAVPSDWQRLGKLHLDVPTAFLGGREVTFYATEPWAIGPILLAISKWEADLPSRARFDWAEEVR